MRRSACDGRLRQLLTATGATIGSRLGAGLLGDDTGYHHGARAARARRRERALIRGLLGDAIPHDFSVDSQRPDAGKIYRSHRGWIL